jgi:Flp pilus assembly protein TadD
MMRNQGAEDRSDDSASVDDKLTMGDHYHQRGNLARAAVAYLQAARLDPDAIEPRLRLANVELTVDPTRAERSFLAVLEKESEETMAWFGLGLARLAQANLEGAREALERAAELDPESPAPRSALGAVYDRLGRHGLAQGQLERALELDPNDVAVLNNLGISYLLAGRAPKAEELFRRAVELDWDDRATHNNLGLCVGMQERYEEALEVFRQSGDEQSALNNLGYVYFLTGQPEEAVRVYERALLAGGGENEVVLSNLERALDALEGPAETARR